MLNFLLPILITVIGDSQGGIAAPILRSRGYNVVDLHKDGIRTEATCRTQIGRIGAPDVVIVFLGSNHYDDAKIPNVSCVLNGLPRTAKCLWIGPPFIRDKTYRFENELRSLVEQRCSYISLQDIKNLPDKIHPRGRLAAQMVNKIINAIE